MRSSNRSERNRDKDERILASSLNTNQRSVRIHTRSESLRQYWFDIVDEADKSSLSNAYFVSL
ncbi:hypothetical protein [Gloeocapsopsis dulcis]|uniref:hypothetical protein n=1 Tax=Gloeocapsopsis dulcis TaxID=2859516 RepID=UPI001F3AD36D|nr:hypothetical protein [Gloeocapsopsis dulcis]WNN89430.1 hypothetical protein P0S91_24890 [Gloeocapsopsis dulcis]